MAKINEDKLKQVAKDLYRGRYRTRLNPQINYDYSDGDIWVDWMMQGSWKEYHSRTILLIPLVDVLTMGDKSDLWDDKKYIDYEEGLREAILNQIYIEKKYGGLIDED